MIINNNNYKIVNKKLEIVNNINFNINTNLLGREIYEKETIKLNTFKMRKSYLKILTWNCRSLNNYIKMNFLKRLINCDQPDIIYIIDSNYDNLGNWRFYDKFFDGRNILYIRNEINYGKVVTDEPFYYFKIEKLKLNFVYIIPNLEKTEKVFWQYIIDKLINNNEIIVGDINMNSNVFIKNIIDKYNYKLNIYGEETMQTIIITKNIKKVKCYLAPSDHQIIYAEIWSNFESSSFLKLNYIKNKTDYNQVKDILEGKQLELKFNYQIKNIRLPMSNKYLVIRKIVNFFLKNNPSLLYKYFNNVWSKFKKEPLLGDNVSNKIIESIKIHLKHNNNKKKILFKNNDIIGFNTFPTERLEIIEKKSQRAVRVLNLFKIKGANSRAKTEDFLGLKEIGDKIKIYLENKKFNKKLKETQNILFNLFNYCNNNQIEDKAKVFYLIKNKKLENFADVRLITILPTSFRIYEALTYYEITEGLNEIINKKEIYQFGGINKSGTINALNFLRYKIEKLESRNKNKGILVTDISFGYDSINWSILDNFIENDNRLSQRLKKLLKFWTIFNKNMNLWIANDQIKRNIGIPMGSALSPIIFVYYVDNCLSDFEFKKDLDIYIDDVSMIINTDDNPKIKINKLKQALKRGELDMKEKKTFIIANDKEFFKELTNYKIIERFTFLGRDLLYVNDNLEPNDESIVIIDDNRIKKFPKWLLLCEKRILFNGALQAKQRFISFMMSIKDKNVLKQHFKNIFDFYNNNFDHLRYKIVMFLTTNMFRFMLDSFSLFKLIENYQLNKEKIKDINKDKKTSLINCAISYVDGSYNDIYNTYGSGFILIYKNEKEEIIKEEYSTGSNNKEFIKFRNIAGEIIATQNIISHAIYKKIENLYIYYDYEGIEKWANNKWNASKKLTINYKKFINENKNKINIKFIKVKAHSNNKGNEEADWLAKRGANTREFYKNITKLSNKEFQEYKIEVNEIEEENLMEVIEDQEQIIRIIKNTFKINLIDKDIDDIIDKLEIDFRNIPINKINIQNCFQYTTLILDDLWRKFKINIILKHYENKNFDYERYIYIKNSLIQCSLINKHAFLIESSFLHHEYWIKDEKKRNRIFLLKIIQKWKNYLISIFENSLDNIKKHINIINWLNNLLKIKQEKIEKIKEDKNKIFKIKKDIKEEKLLNIINEIFQFLITLEKNEFGYNIHNKNKNKRNRSSRKDFNELSKDIWKITRKLFMVLRYLNSLRL